LLCTARNSGPFASFRGRVWTSTARAQIVSEDRDLHCLPSTRPEDACLNKKPALPQITLQSSWSDPAAYDAVDLTFVVNLPRV
jgi:hypothetical protein